MFQTVSYDSFSFFCDLGPPVAQFAEFSKVPTVFQNFVVPCRCAARRRRRAARPVVLPLVALLPLAVVVPHVFVPPVTVVVLPVAALGCAFCFVFWFLPGLIFRNPWLPRNPRNTRRN